MSRSGPKVLLAACLATLVVVLLGQAGVLRGLDDRLLDLRLRHWPRAVEPMSSDVVLVDIDDRSLERIGRWPWPRTRLADCVVELGKAGARTIALDLDLSDPQGLAYDATLDAIIDGDLALAEAADDRLVLAILPTEDELPGRWADAGGDAALLTTVLGRLKTNPGDDPTTGLQPNERATVEATLHMLRRAAVERAIAHGAAPEALLSAAGNQRAVLQPLVEAAQRRAAVRDQLPGLVQQTSQRMPSAADRMPLPGMLAKSGGVGYVTILYRDPDGAIRRILSTVPMSDTTAAMPLGLAAAAHFLGIDEASITVTDSRLALGNRSLPLVNGLLTLNWPRSPMGPDWPDMHRIDASTPRFHGHLGMAEIVELAAARRIERTINTTLRNHTATLIRAIRGTPDLEVGDWLAPEIREELTDEIDFTLGDVRTDADLATMQSQVDDDTGTLLLAMLRWRQLADAHATAIERIALVETALHEAVNDKLVFVGWTATGALADFVQTAAGPRTPGVLVHAALADMLLQKRTLRELPGYSTAIITALLGLLAAIITAAVSPWAAAVVVVLVACAWLGVDLAAFNAGLLFPAAAPLVSLGASWATGTGTRAVLEQRERTQITRQFRARVPGALVDELARNPQSVSMTGQQREVSILFADLAGFTTASERMGPEATVSLLNRCMRDLTAQLTDHGAYVNKFLGDGLLAFWSAFHPQDDQAELACRAALACSRAVTAINLDRPGQPALHARIGIATGEAIVGDCGAPPDLNDYTVIGDTANLASRLESANKQFGTTILVDERTIECLGNAKGIAHRPLGPIGVVGRVAPVDMHELRHDPPGPAEADAWHLMADAMRRDDMTALTDALDKLDATGVDRSFTALWRAHLIEGRDEPTVLRLSEK